MRNAIAATNSPGCARSSGRRGRNPRAAARDRLAAAAEPTVAPSAISAGIESPIGEPLATLPPSVPLLRIGTDAKRTQASCSSGHAASSAAKASVSVTAAPISQIAVVVLDAGKLVDIADVDDVADVAMLLGDPEADVGGAGDDARPRMRGQRPRQRIARARREPAPAVRLVVEARRRATSCAAPPSSSSGRSRGCRPRRRRRAPVGGRVAARTSRCAAATIGR